MGLEDPPPRHEEQVTASHSSVWLSRQKCKGGRKRLHPSLPHLLCDSTGNQALLERGDTLAEEIAQREEN